MTDPSGKLPDNDANKAEAEAKLQRLISQNQAERSLFKKMTVSFKENRFGPLVFALLFAGVGGFLIFHSSAAPLETSDTNTNSTNTITATSGSNDSTSPQGSITLVPSSQMVANNATVTVDIYEDSLAQNVNAVQSDLTYTTDKLEYVSIDDTGSAFGVSAQKMGANGKVVIARGTITPVKGKQLVAKVTFKAIAASGDAAVSVANSSQILRSDTNTNILKQFSSVSLKLSN